MKQKKKKLAAKPRALPSPGFLYKAVTQQLRQRITDGVYAPGAQLPSMAELVKEFGVSSITVRRVIRDLALEGLLTSRQGLGAFVANKRRIVRSLGTSQIVPIDQEMRRAGVEPSVREIGVTVVQSDKEPVPVDLVAAGEMLYRVERITLADNEPVTFDVMWLPRKLADKLLPDLQGHFIAESLASHGISLDHWDYRIEGMTADDNMAERLNVPNGYPLLGIDYAACNSSGQPLLAGRTTARSDRFILEMSARPNWKKHPSKKLR